MKGLICSSLLLILQVQAFVEQNGNTSVFDMNKLRIARNAIGFTMKTFSADPWTDRDKYSYYDFFVNDADAAVIAGFDDRCYVAFRPSMATNPKDLLQQVLLGTEKVCHPHATGDADCCEVRTGLYQAYHTNYLENLKVSLQACIDTVCDGLDDCVILTGMSQGASTAAIAHVELATLNPTVYAFGQYPTFYPGCSAANATRWHRFVNSGYCKLKWQEFMAYDFQFIDNRGEIDYGQMIILTDDATAVADMGWNTQSWKTDCPIMTGLSAHTIQRNSNPWARPCGLKGYEDRLNDLLAQYEGQSLDFVIPSSGFASGVPCTREMECHSRLCVGASKKKPGKCA